MLVRRLLLLSLLLLPSLGGCAPRVSPLAAHTIAVGENQDQDVVWIVQDREVVLRCQNEKSGPVCRSAALQ